MLDGEALGDRSRDAILHAVRTEGTRRRRRRVRQRAAVISVAGVIALVAAVGLAQRDVSQPQPVTAAGGGSQGLPGGGGRDTSSTSTTSTTVISGNNSPLPPWKNPSRSPKGSTSQAQSGTSTPPASGGPILVPDNGAGATTTTALVCRNSTDPACGEFRWDPQPANAPVAVTVEVVSIDGPHVVIQVTADDPDALASANCLSVDWRDGGPNLGGACSTSRPLRHGPWDPPTPNGGSRTFTFEHDYSGTGEFEIVVTVTTYSNPDAPDGDDPYSSTGSGVAVAVVEAQSTGAESS